MVRHGVAAISALLLSARYAPLLDIRRSERARYLRKSVNCALCYVGLGRTRSIGEAWRAGRAAFLSTAFDVATDWRRFDPPAIEQFEVLLWRLVPDADTRQLALDLCERKRHRTFGDSGLGRGEVALQLILRVMTGDDRPHSSWPDVAVVGQTLQLVDDVLDVEHDNVTGEENCLNAHQGERWRRMLLERDAAGELARWFPAGTVLAFVVRRAVRKAAALRLQPSPRALA
jgi:hypothetical protein